MSTTTPQKRTPEKEVSVFATQAAGWMSGGGALPGTAGEPGSASDKCIVGGGAGKAFTGVISGEGASTVPGNSGGETSTGDRTVGGARSMILTKGGEASTPLEETSFAFNTCAGNRISVTGFRLTVLQL